MSSTRVLLRRTAGALFHPRRAAPSSGVRAISTQPSGLAQPATATATAVSHSSSGSSSSSSGRRLLLVAVAASGLVASSALLAATMSEVEAQSGSNPTPPALISGSKLAGVAHPSKRASGEEGADAAGDQKKEKKKPLLTSISDLDAIDFRSLGNCECPPLPDHAPQWLKDQAADPSFQYRDLGAILDVSDHLLYDGLSGERRLTEVYYFCEKVASPEEESKPTGSAGGNGTHAHPHLPPSLDFQPQVPPAPAPVKAVAEVEAEAPAPTSFLTSAFSYLTSIFRFASAEAGPAAASSSSSAPKKAHTPRKGLQTPLTAGSPGEHQTPTGPEVRAVFHVGKSLCGHRGIIHGGMTAALMDEVSGAATFCASGAGQFTVNLNVNYLRPVRAHQYLLVRAQAVKQERNKTFVNISVEDGVGGVFARGTALYVKPKTMPAAVLVAATQ